MESARQNAQVARERAEAAEQCAQAAERALEVERQAKEAAEVGRRHAEATSLQHECPVGCCVGPTVVPNFPLSLMVMTAHKFCQYSLVKSRLLRCVLVNSGTSCFFVYHFFCCLPAPFPPGLL